MNSVAFNIFGIPIAWYGIIISCGVIIALIVTHFNAKSRGMDFDIFVDGFLWAFPLSIVGARTYYVLFELKNYHSFMDMINIRNGGLAIHGGLIAAAITVLIYTKVKKLSFLKCMDVVAPAIILAQAIGRWGNFMNQEAHGGPVSQQFISHFPTFIQKGMFINGQYYHPTFLYESMWNLAVFICLMIIFHKVKNRDGIVLGCYMMFYSIGRFFIEGLRTDSLMFLGLRIAQLVSLAGIVLGLILVIYSFRKKKTETAIN